MGQLVLTGSLTAGPPQGGPGQFPAATFNEPIEFGSARPFQAASGLVQRTISSPSAFAPLPAIGATGDITAADFLYLHANAQLEVQIEAKDGGVGTTTVVIAIGGNAPFMMSAAPGHEIVAVGVKGAAQLVYFASGQV